MGTQTITWSKILKDIQSGKNNDEDNDDDGDDGEEDEEEEAEVEEVSVAPIVYLPIRTADLQHTTCTLSNLIFTTAQAQKVQSSFKRHSKSCPQNYN